MTHKPLSTLNLSMLNLQGRVFRTVILISIVALLSFSLFAGSIFSGSLTNGLETARRRLGADIAIVPLGYETGYEGIILSGQPIRFYFNKSVETQLAQIDGVEKTAGQFFLTSISSDCCSVPVQIIGIDPQTDFVTMPWISNVYKEGLNDGQLIIGADIYADKDKTLTFYGKKYTVAAQLERSSKGMDNSVFVTLNTIHDLAETAHDLGYLHNADIFNGKVDDSLSVVLLRIADDYKIDSVVTNIRRKIPDISVVKQNVILTGLSEKLATLNSFISVMSAAIWFLTVIILLIFYTFSVNVRKKEFAVMRILGATRKRLIGMVLAESLLTSTAGAVAGLSLAALVIFPYSTYIRNQLKLPFLLPGIGVIVVFLVFSLIISIATGTLSAIFAVFGISKAETYITLRDGE